MTATWTDEAAPPKGYCQCGCGAKTNLAQRQNPARGYVKGEPMRFLPGHANRLRDRVGPFLARINKTDTCWLWTGTKNGHGYGRVEVDGRGTGAHRFSYELHVGPIPEGLTLDHLCRVRHCVNPDHLEPVTSAVNSLRAPDVPSTVNANKTHCDHGHEFTPENTAITRKGWRRCRECSRAHQRAARARRRASGGAT